MQKTEIFVPKSLAIKLQSKGFDWDCVGFYSNRHDEVRFKSYGVLMEEQLYGAPTYDQVVGWFASKHNISIEIIGDWNCKEYKPSIATNLNYINLKWVESRQTALLTAFEEALKLI